MIGDEYGELEGLGPFIFLVVLLTVAFVMDILM